MHPTLASRCLSAGRALGVVLAMLACAAHGCGYGDLSAELYTPQTPDAETPITLECQPDTVRCFNEHDYGLCSAEGKIVGVGECTGGTFCVVGASRPERPCVSYLNQCLDGQPFRIDTERVSFEDVTVLKSVQQTVQLTNCGPQTLRLSEAELVGRPAFDLVEPYAGRVLAPGEVLPVRVVYLPTGERSGEEGELRLELSDVDARDEVPLATLRVALEGRAAMDAVVPIASEVIDFGAIPIGALRARDVYVRNNGAERVEIRDVRAERQGVNGAFFEIDWPEPEFALDPGETLALRASFQADEPGFGEVRYSLVVNPWPQSLPYPELVVRGGSVDSYACRDDAAAHLEAWPEGAPELATTSRLRVPPMTRLYLDASASNAGGSGPAEGYHFELAAPSESAAKLEPVEGQSDAKRSLRVDRVGEYTVSVHALDASNTTGCDPHHVVIEVIPEGSLVVEATWVTPGDVSRDNEGLGAGTDLDLHLVRDHHDGDPLIPHDTWVQDPNDCYWLNPRPDWGRHRFSGDDCAVLRSDNDGWGPEIIAVSQAEDRAYTVGLYVLDDHGYGASFASVHVYLNGVLRGSFLSDALAKGDMWSVARVRPREGVVEEIGEVSSDAP